MDLQQLLTLRHSNVLTQPRASVEHLVMKMMNEKPDDL